MKYLKQLMTILAVSFAGELLKYALPFPVPAGIYGLALLFLLLETGILKLSAIKETAKYLIEIMPLMFIPAGVGLITSWDALRPVLFPVTVIMVASTFAVMAVSGRVTQRIMRKKGQKGMGK